VKTYLIAFLISALVTALLTLVFIPVLKRIKAGQSILSYVKEHQGKNGTPTMGGLFFVVTAITVNAFFADKSDIRSVAVISAIGLGYMTVGFLDDYIKIKLKHNEGLKPSRKILFQTAIAVVFGVFCYTHGFDGVIIPFTDYKVNIGLWIIPAVIFVFLATTNCVNLTDGLDGLAGGVSCIYFIIIAFIIIRQGAVEKIENYALLSLCIAGALVGFLLFNTDKASVFMGDTGSLALGGLVAAISITSGNMLYIPIIGVIYVITGISVMLQVIYYKKRRKRIFLMAPLHHHLQMKGMTEGKISFIYRLITFSAGAVCLLYYC